EKFRAEMASANAAVDAFRQKMAAAGNEVTAALSGLIDTQVTVSSPDSAAVISTPAAGAEPVNSGVPDWRSGGIPGAVTPALAGMFAAQPDMRAAGIPELDRSETVIGAVGGGGEAGTPVNITTTVELDGDKVGESVNRFNMRRNRITNGMYG
ncbi:MAG: hypothetical protein J6X60_08230, partial [Ruminiclostridium sp.]|nr:hypothetical protein [Ruminiclostridium sp.]